MMRILQFFCGSLLILSMTSCANKKTPVENSAAIPASSVASTAKASGFAALQTVISSTKKAVEAGKLDVAKTEIAKFEDSWKNVEDGVKSKSAENYKAIEDGIESIDTGIAKKQSKDALLASLQKLSQNVDKASK